MSKLHGQIRAATTRPIANKMAVNPGAAHSGTGWARAGAFPPCSSGGQEGRSLCIPRSHHERKASHQSGNKVASASCSRGQAWTLAGTSRLMLHGLVLSNGCQGLTPTRCQDWPGPASRPLQDCAHLQQGLRAAPGIHTLKLQLWHLGRKSCFDEGV